MRAVRATGVLSYETSTNYSPLAPIPGGGHVSKRTKFGWSPLAPGGDFNWINKHDLVIDHTYQRDASSHRRVLEIAADFDWVRFGVLIVAVVWSDDRPKYKVLEGGHRTRAAWLRDDVESLPCMVFNVESLKDEALAFYHINLSRTAVSPHDKHVAAVVGEKPDSIRAEEILNEFGYSVSKDSTTRYGFKSIATLTDLVGKDAALARRVFGACASIAHDGEQTPQKILQGLFALAKRFEGHTDVLARPYLDRLQQCGFAGIGAEVTRKEQIVGKGGAVVYAAAILDLLNKGRRSRRLDWLEVGQ